MKVIIYAAGVANRLSSATGGKLKCLVDLNGHALIDYQLGLIEKAKPEKIVIVLGMEHESLKEHIGHSYRGIPVSYYYNPDYKTKGNMLSFWAAKSECDTDIIFTTSDLLCPNENASAFYQSQFKNKILIDTKPELLQDDDPVKVNIQKGKIIKVLKRLPQNEVSGMAIGIYQFDKKSIGRLVDIIADYLDRGEDNKSLYYPINDLVKEIEVQPVFCPVSEWFDVDTPEELIAAKSYLKNNPSKFEGRI